MHQPTILRRLGSISTRRFMREYWQRKPCLIQGAIPNWAAPIDRARLFELARDPYVESRLITSFDAQWNVAHGPLSRMPSLRRSHWTLLVQGVDLHDDAARDFLSRFRFVADARLDDLMVSYATDGGGVGPHVDSYDVFLLQASGRRRWRISDKQASRVRPGALLNTVESFSATDEWVLDAGDMLYLPPGIAHEGVALGACISYSIGFRAPEYQQLLDPWFAEFAEHALLRGRYRDPGITPARRPALLPAVMTRDVHAKLSQYQPQRADTERFLLRYLSEPKSTTVFDAPTSAPSRARFRRAATLRGLTLDRRTRIIHSARALGINGEWIDSATAPIAALAKFADRRELSSAMAASLPASAWKVLYQWYRAGWIAMARRSP
ncbi:MAG: cupin domain-containing protein [Burkholderiaceae bacterium]